MGSISYTADEEWDIRRDMDDQLRALQALRPSANVDFTYLNQLQGDALQDIAYSAMLSILRDIEVLEVDRCVWSLFRDETVLEVISHTHHRLTEVRFIGEPGNGESFSYVSMFASIPSVRKIYGSNVFGPDVVPLQAPSNLEDLYLERSGINGPSFGNLLTSVKKLKRLYYENMLDSDEPHTYEPRRLVNSLRVHALESLERLSLIDRDRDYSWDDNDEDMARPCSLREFKALKHVAIECSLFIKETISENQDQTLEHGFYSEEDLGNDMLRLVDVLPPTLETLVLYHPRGDYDVKMMFTGLGPAMEERLPKLGSIQLIGKNLDSKDIEGDCRELGIRLVVTQSEDV
ncbi:MAG: hypothetical protein Q9224_004708 [Gallowayella concinna]